MIWQQDIECMELSALKDLQSERLRQLVQQVYEKVPFYTAAFNQQGIVPSDIRTIEDLGKLPFTRKTDLRDNYPFNLFAVPMRDILEIHASSGTTGNPTVVAYTRRDIEIWSQVMARTLAASGATQDDVVQNAYGYGLFTGGLGVHYGALELGAAVVPMSSGGTKRQLKLMGDFGSTIITCTPSYALFMAEEALNIGIDPLSFRLKSGIYGAEPWTNGMRKEIEARWGLKAIDIYGLSEIIGPGVAIECIEGQDGLHLFSDHFYPEIIEPNGEHPVSPGEAGELVLTTLTKEAIPLIRYRTGDIVTLTEEPCPHCGRTSPRMSKVKGRTDDMLIIRGVNVFPSQIESILLDIEEAEPHYLLVVDRVGSLDQLEVRVEVNETIFSDEIKVLENLRKRIQREIESTLGIVVSVKLVEPRTIERSMGKAVRVIDNRELY
ncbi:AMP-binding protein [candidate division KSB3 bacterium]|uniref:Phenylacetate-coenzyme A ligase n=1 Tax=candidate division KSB3 bacterium TaxID=2044937 RepID=A0A9D5Q7Y2_9BACT|nr:AMP-binding protein [candidate division KSB3 bacterium]MBD3327390.1 AMP-binding protein [candidate division KSB3 bacterium]